MDSVTRSRRQEQLRRIDAWLRRLRVERPVMYLFLVLAAALVVIGLAELLKLAIFR